MKGNRVLIISFSERVHFYGDCVICIQLQLSAYIIKPFIDFFKKRIE